METDRSIFLAISELRRRHRDQMRLPLGGPLTEFELRCFSQHGEDGVIAEILARIGVDSGFFVEFGIQTGREGNCVFLADVLGWPGLFIEPDESSFAELAAKYAGNDYVRTVNAAVTPDNVEELFGRGGVPSEPDVLSIDVDGQDYWIWEAVTTYRPRVVVIEYNALLPRGHQLVQPRSSEQWDGTNYFGASLDAVSTLGERKGYRLVHTDLAAINAFFVRSDLSAEVVTQPDQVPRRHQPNYFMQNYRHPPDSRGRSYLDVVSGEFVSP